jgi:hypothetical protein
MKTVILTRCLGLLIVIIVAQDMCATKLRAMEVVDIGAKKLAAREAAEAAEHAAAKKAVSSDLLKSEANELAGKTSPHRPVYEEHAQSLTKKLAEKNPHLEPVKAEEAAALRIKLKQTPTMTEEQALHDIRGKQPAVASGSNSGSVVGDIFFGPTSFGSTQLEGEALMFIFGGLFVLGTAVYEGVVSIYHWITSKVHKPSHSKPS